MSRLSLCNTTSFLLSRAALTFYFSQDNLNNAIVYLKYFNGDIAASQVLQCTNCVETDFWELDFGGISGVEAVQVSKPTYGFLIIPEVEVLGSSGESLLTSNSIAAQSSDLACDSCVYDFDLFSMSNLIDGNTNGVWSGGSLFHSVEQTNPWVGVDLGLTATVSKIIIWNRTDCCQDRIIGAILEVFDSSGTIVHSETITTSEDTYIFEFASPIENVVSIGIWFPTWFSYPPERGIFNLAEIQAFGDIQ